MCKKQIEMLQCTELVCAHLALATHSMVTSDVPLTTLVFLGGMMMVGAMGSAGPPTSGHTGEEGQQRATD